MTKRSAGWRQLVGGAMLGLGLLVPVHAQTITVGVVAKLSIQWPMWVALSKGMLDKAGVKVEVISVGGAAKGAQQLAAGALDMVDGGLPDIVRAIDKGAPARIIAYEVAVPPYSLMAKKDVKRLADLKGRKIMIGGSKDVTKIYLDALMAPTGLKDSDYDLVYAGATSARYAALASGAVDAAILTSPFEFKAQGEGYSMLGDVSKVLPDFPFTAWSVNTNWAAKNRATVTAFLSAWQKGTEWLYQPANRAEAIDILIKAIGSNPEDTAKTYDYMVRDLRAFRRDVKIPAESFQKLLTALITTGDLEKQGNPGRFIDASFAGAVR